MSSLLKNLKSFLFVYICTGVALGQATIIGKNCDLAMVGATDKNSFLEFDRELRYALANHNAGIMAVLVKTPLQVNDDRGSYFLQDPKSLQLRFDEIFPSNLRETVLKGRPEELTCLADGVMYGAGNVWIELTGQRYAVASVNVPNAGNRKGSPSINIEFACNADKRRVIVDTVGNNAPRYRAWTKPHSVLDKPDLEILDGRWESQGSGSCRYSMWTFRSNGVSYSLEGPGGCFEQGHEPPSNANGSLTVSVAGKPDVSWWCR